MSIKTKFRAWHGEQKEMSFHWAVDSGLGKALWHKMFSGVSEEDAKGSGYDKPPKYDFFEDIIFLQYTGLKDIKGVDIYEGDLLKWDGNRIKESKLDSDYLIEVKLSDYLTIELVEHTNEYMFRYDTDGYDLPYFLTEAEVIGNVYEHPHLVS